MQVTDKLLKPVAEMKYLNAENVDRYRCIMRIFYESYEKLKYWLYQEEVYDQMIANDYFQNYRLEQCQQDLAALSEWKNLIPIQDTRKVASIEEFKNKKYRYQMSEYSVEIERLIIRLENLSVEGASLEPSLLERIRKRLMEMPEIAGKEPEGVYVWWSDLNNDFIRLNQNYQDYIRDLNSVKVEEMMKTKEFLVFKDKLIDYLQSFVKALHKNLGIIEETMSGTDKQVLAEIFDKEITYELSIPRMDLEITEAMLREKVQGRWESIEAWFLSGEGRESEAAKLFDVTNDIIRRITRYAAQISERNSLGANRREEYAKLAAMFMKCSDVNEAHRLSAMVFGIDNLVHLKGAFVRNTDSMNSGVYEEDPLTVSLNPRIRQYREKTNRSTMRDYSTEKEELKRQQIAALAADREQIDQLTEDGQIDFGKLPMISARVREVLLSWISNALEDAEKKAKTEDGRAYYLVIDPNKARCVVHCEDGNFTMVAMKLVFCDN